MSNLIGKLLEAIGYDREGVQNEVNGAAIFNQKFKKSLIPIGGGDSLNLKANNYLK